MCVCVCVCVCGGGGYNVQFDCTMVVEQTVNLTVH